MRACPCTPIKHPEITLCEESIWTSSLSHKQKAEIFYLLAVYARNVCVNHAPALFTAEPEESSGKDESASLLSPELEARDSENWCKPVAVPGLAVLTGLLTPSPQAPSPWTQTQQPRGPSAAPRLTRIPSKGYL